MRLLHSEGIHTLTVLSNVEYEIWCMRNEYPDLKYILADVRDFKSGVFYDVIFNAAAIKHIDFCEDFPGEATHTNVIGLINTMCIPHKKFVHISSDKCVNASSVLGATKLIGERIALNHGATVIRMGNVLNSRGSFLELKKTPFPLTDKRMKRYFIEAEKAAKFIFEMGMEGENRIYIPKMEEKDIKDLVGEYEIVGRRKGEKLYEDLVGRYEDYSDGGDHWII